MASYRLDLYNYLYEHFNCDIYFLYSKPENVAFDVGKLWRQARFPEKYAPYREICGRRIIKGVHRLLKEKGTGIVFVPEFSPTTIITLLTRFLTRGRYKVVSICDDSIDAITGNDFTRVHTLARKLLAPHLDNLILPDSRSRDWYQQRYGKGVWFPIIADERRMEAEAAKCVQSQRSSGNVLFVGRLVALKNIETLIKAFARIKHDACLTIVGDGECRPQLETLAKDLGANVCFTGAKGGTELHAYYRTASVFVLPSYREAFGAVTNEALVSGCYCLVSEVAGSACLIEKGMNGDIFAPFDTERLAFLIDEYLERTELERGQPRHNRMPMTFADSLDNALKQIQT